MSTTIHRLPINVVTPRAEILNQVRSEKWLVGVRNGSNDEPAEILVYGEVGMPVEYGGTTATDVAGFLRQNKGKPVNVRINSPGGLAFDGVTIHNALLAHDAKVTTTIEGLAGSAASIIAMAGMPVRMYENASLFIHRAMAIAIGNTDMMRDTAEFLDKLDDGIARTYGAKAGAPRTKFYSLMKGKVDGTVLTAREAKDLGLVDEIMPIGPREPSTSSGAPDKAKGAAAGGSSAAGDSPTSETDAREAVNAALQPEAAERLGSVEAAQARRLRERRGL